MPLVTLNALPAMPCSGNTWQNSPRVSSLYWTVALPNDKCPQIWEVRQERFCRNSCYPSWSALTYSRTWYSPTKFSTFSSSQILSPPAPNPSLSILGNRHFLHRPCRHTVLLSSHSLMNLSLFLDCEHIENEGCALLFLCIPVPSGYAFSNCVRKRRCTEEEKR